MSFLKALLAGKKKYYKNHEVCHINIPRYKSLQLKHVHQHAKQHSQMMHYIPDQNEELELQLDREFLFSIVNTCDMTYFPRELKRIEREKEEASQKLQQDVIEVKPELLALLEVFGESAMGKSKSANARSLSLLKTKSKKRSRAEFEAD